jgi:hypothetical protein
MNPSPSRDFWPLYETATREPNLAELDLDWHHLAATYDGTAIAWYADGRFVNSENYTVDTLDNVMMGKRGRIPPLEQTVLVATIPKRVVE